MSYRGGDIMAGAWPGKSHQRRDEMQYFFSAMFAALAAVLWRHVWCAVRAGIVLKPRGNAWWREYRYYQREDEPIRYWISVAVHGVMALLATAATIGVLVKGSSS